jgi:hypothetical protein
MFNIIKNSYFFLIVRSIRNSLEIVFFAIKSKRIEKISYYIQLFIIRACYGLTFFRNTISSKKDNKSIKNPYSENSEESNKVVNDLSSKGYSGEYKLKKIKFELLKKEILKSVHESEIIYQNGEKKKFRNIELKNLDNSKKYMDDNNIYLIKSRLDLTKNSFLKEMINSSFFLEIANKYLNNNKISVNVSLFISNSQKSGNPNNDFLKTISAQKYHFDIDYKKFFKVFMYFTDVPNEKYGGTQFINGTQKYKLKDHYLSRRYNDEEIESKYNDKKIFLGEKSTFFFVDTFGFHKGSRILKSYRINLIIEYGFDHFKKEDKTEFFNL